LSHSIHTEVLVWFPDSSSRLSLFFVVNAHLLNTFFDYHCRFVSPSQGIVFLDWEDSFTSSLWKSLDPCELFCLFVLACVLRLLNPLSVWGRDGTFFFLLNEKKRKIKRQTDLKGQMKEVRQKGQEISF
jgi:hypothetical protein